jgi:hypothetical protein
MKVLVLLAEDPAAWERANEEQRAAVFEAHDRFAAAVARRGAILAGEALAGVDEARTLRPPGPEGADRVLTEGPYAETAEQLGGFYLLDVADLDDALVLCRLLPEGYTIEVRPAVEVSTG